MSFINILTFLFILILIFQIREIEKQKIHKGRPYILNEVGKMRVSNILNKHQDKGVLINNVLLKSREKLVNIGDLFITYNKKIYVIKSLNYSGTIKGLASNKTWIQQKNGAKYYFLNPIFQNEYNLNLLKEFLLKNNIDDHKLISIIVFTDEKSKVSISESGIDSVYDLKSLSTKVYEEEILMKNDIKNILKIINLEKE